MQSSTVAKYIACNNIDYLIDISSKVIWSWCIHKKSQLSTQEKKPGHVHMWKQFCGFHIVTLKRVTTYGYKLKYMNRISI